MLSKMPKSYTGGKIGNFYPMNRINALFGNENLATDPGNAKNEEYRDLLKKLVTNKTGSREGGDRMSKSHTRGSEYGLGRNYLSNT